MTQDSTATQDAKAQLESTLKSQHEHVKSMLSSVGAVDAAQRGAAFLTLRRFLAAHEAAEQASMHEKFRSGSGDAGVVDEREHEEQEAGNVIADLEGLDPSGREFDSAFAAFAESVISHAEAEEHDELPAFLDRISDDDARDIVATLDKVESVAADTATQTSSDDVKFADLLEAAKRQFAVGASGS